MLEYYVLSLAAMLLCGGAVVFCCLAEWFFCYVIFGKEDWFTVLYKVYLPVAAYTILLAPLMFCLTLLMARFVRRRVNG